MYIAKPSCSLSQPMCLANCSEIVATSFVCFVLEPTAKPMIDDFNIVMHFFSFMYCPCIGSQPFISLGFSLRRPYIISRNAQLWIRIFVAFSFPNHLLMDPIQVIILWHVSIFKILTSNMYISINTQVMICFVCFSLLSGFFFFFLRQEN